MLLKFVVISFIYLLVLTLTAFGGSPLLEGVVKDANGRPIKGADVRIEAANFSRTLKTDPSGHYIADGLAFGTYKVTLIIKGQVKASILDANTQFDRPTQLNFTLTGKMAPPTKHMVWIRQDINTRIGSGHWVDIDEKGRVIDYTGFNNIVTTRGPAVQAMGIMMNEE